jgi:hypothetical protein
MSSVAEQGGQSSGQQETGPNQALQATAGKRPGWHVGRQRLAVPELDR